MVHTKRQRAIIIVYALLILLLPAGCSSTSPSPTRPASFPSTSHLPDTLITPVTRQSSDSTVQILGHAGGEVYDLAVQGTYAYLGIGVELAVLDLTNPAHPQRAGYVILPSWVQAVAVAGHYAYAAGNYAMWVVDVSDPTDPRIVGHYENSAFDESASPQDLITDGDMVYLTNGMALKVLDVRDPTQPKEISSYRFFDIPVNQVRHLAVSGHTLYAAVPATGSGTTGQLLVLDIADPHQPRVIMTLSMPANDIALAGSRAYVVGDDGLFILDLTQPAQPTQVGHVPLSTFYLVARVAVQDRRAYVVGTSNTSDGNTYRVEVLDLSDPVHPTALGAVGLAELNLFGGLVPVGASMLYVTSNYNLQSIDLHTPQHPDIATAIAYTPLSRLSLVADATVLAITGNTAYAATLQGLQILDVSNPADIQVTGVYTAAGYGALALNGTLLALLDLFDTPDAPKLTLLDVTQPRTPHVLSHIPLPAFPGASLFIVDTMLYLSSPGGFTILDIANPAAPLEIGRYTTPGAAGLLAVAAGYAYLLPYNEPVIQIISLSDPRSPMQVGTLPEIGDLAVANGYAYLLKRSSDAAADLIVCDLADPSQPHEVNRMSLTLPYPGPIAIAGGNLYVMSGGFTSIFDLGQPAQPVEIVNLPFVAQRPVFADGMVYLPIMQQRELLILRVISP